MTRQELAAAGVPRFALPEGHVAALHAGASLQAPFMHSFRADKVCLPVGRKGECDFGAAEWDGHNGQDQQGLVRAHSLSLHRASAMHVHAFAASHRVTQYSGIHGNQWYSIIS